MTRPILTKSSKETQRMKLHHVALLALTMVFIPLTSSALTLTAGTYAMKWVIPDPLETIGTMYGFGLDKMKAEEIGQVKGLKSSQPYLGVCTGLTFVVDEEKGSGYDTLYVMRGEKRAGDIDLAAATKIALKSYRDRLAPPIADDILIDVPVGEPEKKQIMKAAIDVSVQLGPGRQPTGGAFQLRGGWAGDVKGDALVTLYPLDGNGDGLYDDRAGGNSCSRDSIELQVRQHDSMGSFGVVQTAWLHPGEINMISGKLYSVRISSAGDTVVIHPYSGPTGTVKIVAKDSRGLPAIDAQISCIRNAEGTYSSSDGSGGYTSWHDRARSPRSAAQLIVPAGTYQDLSVQVASKQTLASKKLSDHTEYANPVYVDFDRKGPIEIAAGKTAVINVGGPLKMLIAPDSGELQIAKGVPAKLDVRITAGQDELTGVSRRKDQYAKAFIIGPAGQKTFVGEQDPCEGGLMVKIPATMKTGTYKLRVVMDPRPYADLLTAEKTVRIVDGR
jgi:hypothetical protein